MGRMEHTDTTTRRHPAGVTADRLVKAVDDFAWQLTPAERDKIGEIVHAFREIAEGTR